MYKMMLTCCLAIISFIPLVLSENEVEGCTLSQEKKDELHTTLKAAGCYANASQEELQAFLKCYLPPKKPNTSGGKKTHHDDCSKYYSPKGKEAVDSGKTGLEGACLTNGDSDLIDNLTCCVILAKSKGKNISQDKLIQTSIDNAAKCKK